MSARPDRIRRSQSRTAGADADAVLLAKNPFYPLIARTYLGPERAGCGQSAEALTRAIGTLDDLLDLAPDWRRGLPSSVLLELGATRPASDAQLLAAIIRTDLIERHLGRARAMIAEARSQAGPLDCPAHDLFLSALHEALAGMAPFLRARTIRDLAQRVEGP